MNEKQNSLVTEYVIDQSTAQAAMPSQTASVSDDGIYPASYEWNQIPDAVKNYLDNVTYDPDNYSVSYIDQYAPAEAVSGNYYPIGRQISTSAGVLNRDGYEESVNAGSTTVYNDIPNRHTKFTVSNNGIVSETGSLHPTGTLRQIKCLTSTNTNVRDIGGWTCDGGTVKYGMIFRGGQCGVYDREPLVKQCGVRHDLSLRGTEIEIPAQSPLGSDVIQTHPNLSYSAWWYASIFNADYAEYIKIALRTVFDAVSHNEPIYCHCAAGVDRTGTLSCVLEAILGMSQSDIDKDYELSNFSTGTADDSAARRRNESDWTGLISGFNAYTGSTFRDKVIHFVASLGFTADEINAFRANMIDGTPETVTLNIDTYTITKSGSHVTYDNDMASVDEYQKYEVSITPDSGYLLSSVQVLVGDVDVTDQYFDGKFIPNGTLNVSENGEYNAANYEYVNVNVVGACGTVTSTLNQSTTNNDNVSPAIGQSYASTITANDGYGISNIAVSMNGTDITDDCVTLVE